MAANWTFGKRLGAGFSLVVVLTIAMGAIGFFALESVVESKDAVIRGAGQDLIDAEGLRTSMQKEVANVRGFLLTGDERYADGMQDADAQFAAGLAAIAERQSASHAGRLLGAIGSAEAGHQQEVDQIIARRRGSEDLSTLLVAFDERVIPKFDALAERVNELAAASDQERERGRQASSASAERAVSTLVAVGIAAVLLATVIAVWLTRLLGRQIGESVQQIRSSTVELQAAATQQASGAQEQATAMNEITTTIGELLATSRQIAQSGEHVARMALDSTTSASSGEETVDNARDAVGSIKHQVDTIVQHMLDLGSKSQRIGGILEIINELSEQTNILAINATIEASGAGESGRRFAVVGDEIRKLADRVSGSTKEVRALIEEIRAAVNATVMATEAGSKTVEAGTERFRELQSAFARIGELVTSTMEAGKEIELSTKQQTRAVEQINVAIANVAQSTKETEASSGQTLQTASELATLSDDLSRLVRAQAV